MTPALRAAAAVLAALLALAVSAGAVEAQPGRHRRIAQARAHFEDARRAFEAGDYERALAEFRRSYAIVPTPEVLYDIGTCADYLHRDEEALAAFEQYLHDLPDAADRLAVQARIRSLRTAVAAENTRTPPTPAETAAADAAAADAGSGAAGPAPIDEPSPPLTARWWFWAGVGTVAVATVVVVLFATATTEYEQPTPGDGGVIIEALH